MFPGGSEFLEMGITYGAGKNTPLKSRKAKISGDQLLQILLPHPDR